MTRSGKRIWEALGKSKDANADIAEMAPKITRYEAARAEVADALGPEAPPEAAAHAQAFREAQRASRNKVAQNTASRRIGLSTS